VAPGVVVPVTRPFFASWASLPCPPWAAQQWTAGVQPQHRHRDIAAGATLYMPVYAPGALFSVGTPMRPRARASRHHRHRNALRGRFQLIVRKDLKLTCARRDWTIGSSWPQPNLEEAMKMAGARDHPFITQRFPKLSREEAYMIASVAVDLSRHPGGRRTKGIHA